LTAATADGRAPDPTRSGATPAADVLCDRIASLRSVASGPVLVALDGRSGAGKSTLAQQVAARTAALVIDGDDFYHGGDDAFWRARGPVEKVDLVIDWRRQRTLLTKLGRGEPARWQPYDWEADDGRHGAEMSVGPAAVVILDGAYSARTELADHFALRVLLHVPRPVRRESLLRREGERYRAEWEARWSEAEDLYFEQLMPPGSFDLVLHDA
jgi:uridine kinase